MRLREGDKIASMDIIPASLQKDLEVASKDSENK
jgi:DNA gyrase subunit A